VHSQILDSLRAIIRLGTYALFPLGIGLFLRTLFMDSATLNDAILSAVAAVVGMIPQGLVLLTSSILAIATTRLASRKVLVQQTYCVETLARVDTLCLDKTGTITTGRMEVSRVEPAPGHTLSEVDKALAEVVRASEGDANDTAQALLDYANKAGVERGGAPLRVVPFTSRRKCSGCVTADGRALVLERCALCPGRDVAWLRRQTLRPAFDPCERVLVVCEVDGLRRRGRTPWHGVASRRGRHTGRASRDGPTDHALLHRAGRRPARHFWRRPGNRLGHRGKGGRAARREGR
jgi:cation-transporting ATPase E